jgi:hypothetical protein
MSETTRRLIEDARIQSAIGAKLTKEQRLLLLLGDYEWHSARELALKVSHRFGGYLFTLKAKGVVWEKRREENAPRGEVWFEYRLVAGPQMTMF